MNTLKISFTVLVISVLLACSGGEKNASPNKVVKKKQTNKTEQISSENSKEKEDTPRKMEVKSDPPPPGQIKKAKEILASVNKDDVDNIDAAKKFKLFCSTCHGFKGDMMVNGAKDLTVSKISLENAVAQVYHGKGLMTPYKGVLKDHEIVAVCKYIETLRK